MPETSAAICNSAVNASTSHILALHHSAISINESMNQWTTILSAPGARIRNRVWVVATAKDAVSK